MKEQTEYFPLEIRSNWQAVAPNEGARSAMPPLDEIGMGDLVCSMARFAAVHKDEHVMTLSQKFDESFAGKVIGTHAKIGHYLSQYIQENTLLKAQTMTEMGLGEGDVGQETRACAYIAKNDGLSFGAFLEHWLNHVEPEYAQSAMLHTHDALKEIIDRKAASSFGVQILRNAYTQTGLQAVSDTLRNQLPKAENQPSLTA